MIPAAGEFARPTLVDVKGRRFASAPCSCARRSRLRSRGAFGAAAPARVQIVAREYSFTLSRLHVRVGTATLELDNFGQDPHDLRLQRVGAKHVAGLGKVAPGQRTPT